MEEQRISDRCANIEQHCKKKTSDPNFHRLNELALCQSQPPIKPTAAIPTEVSTVHGPGPKGVRKSLIVIERKPTVKPAAGPPMIPATMVKKAVGLTFGGPPAKATLSAAFAAEKQATNARPFVRVGFVELSEPLTF
jgi:hypothetical protein